MGKRDLVQRVASAFGEGAFLELERALARASPTELLRLERDLRSASTFRQGSLWAYAQMTHATLGYHLVGPYGPSLAAVLSFHRDGRVRESAIVHLAHSARVDHVTLAAFVLRLNDFVDPVRHRALAALERLEPREHVEAYARTLPLIDASETWLRAGQTSFAREVRAKLRADGARQALWRATADADVAVRLSTFKLLFELGPAREVLDRALDDRDASLRRWAARLVLSARVDASDRVHLLPRLERDANPRIRLRGVRARAREGDDPAALQAASLDVDATIRYVARAALLRMGVGGSRERYLAAIQAPSATDRVRIGALAGLSDVGREEDLPIVLHHLAHGTSRVRAEACRTAALLAPAQLQTIVAPLARDPNRKVAHQARVALAKAVGRA